MEDGKAAAQQQMLQQQLLLQHIQRQKDATSRFPSNIDAHLRPQYSLLHHRPLNPSSIAQQIAPVANLTPNSSASPANNNPQQQQQKASLQLAYQDAWRVCHPDFKRPFSSLEDACERLLPYHVVADYEADEDDKILDTATTSQVLSRSQQWDHNIAAKVAEFTATFEKQVLAFNIISRKRGLGEFRTEEKMLMEQFLLQDERRALLELRAEMDSRQKASLESHEATMRMAESREMMGRGGPMRGSARAANLEMGEPEQHFQQDEMMNGWGSSGQKDEKAPSEDFLNDDETENGDGAMQSGWSGEGELDLNAR